MSERETKTLNINGKELEVKSYATALEVNNIQQAYFKGSKVEMIGDQPKLSEVNPNIQFEVEAETIRQLVISFDQNREDIVKRIQNLPVDEYTEIVTELDNLTSKKKTEKEA